MYRQPHTHEPHETLRQEDVELQKLREEEAALDTAQSLSAPPGPVGEHWIGLRREAREERRELEYEAALEGLR